MRRILSNILKTHSKDRVDYDAQLFIKNIMNLSLGKII
jgi:hypothetical protein